MLGLGGAAVPRRTTLQSSDQIVVQIAADIIANRRRITADTALRLSLYFGNSPEFWMNLQTHYDVKMARRKLKPQDAKRIRARRAA